MSEDTGPIHTIDEAIARVVREEIRKLNTRASPLKTKSEAAEYLRCSENSIDALVQQGKLHPSYYLRYPMFAIEELDQLIEESRRA